MSKPKTHIRINENEPTLCKSKARTPVIAEWNVDPTCSNCLKLFDEDIKAVWAALAEKPKKVPHGAPWGPWGMPWSQFPDTSREDPYIGDDGRLKIVLKTPPGNALHTMRSIRRVMMRFGWKKQAEAIEDITKQKQWSQFGDNGGYKVQRLVVNRFKCDAVWTSQARKAVKI